MPIIENGAKVNLCSPRVIGELRKKYGFSPKKGLGQNFIADRSVPLRMAELSDLTGFGVLEVGPGIGALTRELAERAERVVAVELDEALIPVLGETLAGYANVKVIQGDILKVDLASLLESEFAGMPVKVVANLPYYITTPVVMGLLESGTRFESITVMVQREVAQRLVAPPGGKDYGAVGVAASYYAETEILFDVPRGCFYPPPNVDSAVVMLTQRKSPLLSPDVEAVFFRIIRASFSMRRKTLINALSGGGVCSKDMAARALSAAGLDLNIRGERLSLADFASLAGILAEMGTAPTQQV